MRTYEVDGLKVVVALPSSLEGVVFVRVSKCILDPLVELYTLLDLLLSQLQLFLQGLYSIAKSPSKP